LDERVDPLLSTEGRSWLLNILLEAPPEKIIEGCNIQLLNLLCADRLPGNEDIDIRGCLTRLDSLADYIKGSIERTYRVYGPSAQYSFSKQKTWMATLITRMKQGFGAAYSPSAKADLDAGVEAALTNASEIFINGLLHADPKRRLGTCASIPVLATAIARKLGYPVRLACAYRHRYCRWEDNGHSFNIEASNPMGMAVQSDEHYRQHRGGLPASVSHSTFHFRSLTPAEEFASFMQERVAVLRDAGRYDETFLWSARALQFAPDDPIFPYPAYLSADLALKHRLRIKHPEIKIHDGHDFFYNIGDLLAPQECSLVETIVAHYRESQGQLKLAREAYEDSCRHNFHGNNEQRDLQRFLRKFNLPVTRKPLLPCRNGGIPRRVILKCPPEQQADELRKAARYFETHGEPLKARDALHDLYMFDPCDAEVFLRVRALEALPLFQTQLKALIEKKRRELNKSKPTGGVKPAALVVAKPSDINWLGSTTIVLADGRILSN
jgi:hypothetical protein